MTDFAPHYRRPFPVEAIQITEENMEEIVDLIGGQIRQKTNEDGTVVSFIKLDRRVIPNIPKAYAGFWVTQLGTQYQCYSDKAFRRNFLGVSDLNRDELIVLADIQMPEEE